MLRLPLPIIRKAVHPVPWSILGTCRKCYEEARPVFLETACFNVRDVDRMVASQYLGNIRHLNLHIPATYEEYCGDPVASYPNLKTLTILIHGYTKESPMLLELLSHAACPGGTDAITEDDRRHYECTRLSARTFQNDLTVLWSPPESFIYHYMSKRDSANAKYKIYMKSLPNVAAATESRIRIYAEGLRKFVLSTRPIGWFPPPPK